MKKQKLFIVSLFILLLFLNSCKPINLDDIHLYFNKDIIKQDLYINWGHFTAYDSGRIYYKATIDGKSGIYSMKEDGSDIRPEIEGLAWNPIIYNNKIYFLAPYDRLRTDGQYLIGIFEKNRLDSSVKLVYRDIPIKDSQQVTRAYLSSDEDIVLGIVSEEWGNNFSYKLWNTKDDSSQVYSFENLETIKPRIIQSGDIYYLTDNQQDRKEEEPLKQKASIFLKSSGVTLNSDVIYDELLFQGKEEGFIYLTYQNKLIQFDEEIKEINDVIEIDIQQAEFDEKDSFIGIEKVLFSDNCIFAYMKIYRGKSRIYIIDKESFITRNIIEVDKIIGVYKEHLIYEKNNKIYKRLVTNEELGNENKILRVKDNYNEICANWLFVYSEKKNGVNELTKINLDTGQIIEEEYHRTEND